MVDTPTPAQKNRRTRLKSRLKQAVVTEMVRSNDGPLTVQQIHAAAELMEVKPLAVKLMIQQAREKFGRSAETYVDGHLVALKGAVEDRDWETAGKISQWAMTNLAAEGERVIERPEVEAGSGGPKVMIGIKLGGIGEDTRSHGAVTTIRTQTSDNQGDG